MVVQKKWLRLYVRAVIESTVTACIRVIELWNYAEMFLLWMQTEAETAKQFCQKVIDSENEYQVSTGLLSDR